MNSVTASDLVRHFGLWRDRALSQPVYVHHHGRAKLVLASVDFMEHLVSSHGGGAGDRPLAELLDRVDTIVIVVDGGLRIVGASAPARRHFLRADGEQLDAVLADGVGAVLLRAVRLVLGGGPPERLQLRVGPRGERRVDLMIEPFGDGVCIVGQDRTAADEAAAAVAGTLAIEQALAALGGVVTLRINLRGYIVAASAAFEAMTGLPSGGYRSVRLPTLFDLPTRVGVGDALERTIDTLDPTTVSARLVSNSGAGIPVCVAFSAEMLRASEELILAAVRAT